MNATVARLTVRGLLGRRRALLLLVLPLVLVGMAAVVRVVAGADDGTAVGLVGGFGLGTIVPLVALLAGTGSIGPEIDDGSIVYLLSKPISRFTILVSKLATAVVVALALGALPLAAAMLVLADSPGALVVPYLLGAAAACTAYAALFLCLAVVTRNAVIVGLLYAIVWETTVAGFVPGAQNLSVRQWSLGLTEALLGADADRFGVTAAVAASTGGALLVALTVAATYHGARRLQTLPLTSAE
ncbi:ABC transporter permease subunit [Kineosporia sp. R_H_3]|uniref:ABC transporter permease subunit n=1 Tax=Kineosporia sp. R_H_3 TaxID=1961848 RepID=UPI000B4BB138|nr:ABC transporter permease subunit [Kineosporia sp. R_H_3]